jgi:hypothetical protein
MRLSDFETAFESCALEDGDDMAIVPLRLESIRRELNEKAKRGEPMFHDID